MRKPIDPRANYLSYGNITVAYGPLVTTSELSFDNKAHTTENVYHLPDNKHVKSNRAGYALESMVLHYINAGLPLGQPEPTQEQYDLLNAGVPIEKVFNI